MTKIDAPTEEEKQNILKFLDSGFFEIRTQADYKFFGVKWGYLKQLKTKYTRKEILKFLNRIEELLNFGVICENCLVFCEYWSEDDANADGFKCLKCGELY